MSKLLSNEDFLKKLYLVNEYYKRGEFKVLSKVKKHPESLIVKDEFGYCRMTVNSLFKNSKPSSSSSVFSKNYLINKLSKVNKDVYKRNIIIVGEHRRGDDYILVKDKFGILRVSIGNLLSNKKPSIQAALDKTSYFVNKCKYLKGDIFDYTKTIYGENGSSEITVTCKTHGDFITTPNKHIWNKFCPSCFENYKSKEVKKEDINLTFINKAKKVHGNRYEYYLVDYKNAHSKVGILCEKHGVFEQNPNNHLNGQGCPKCVSDYKVGSMKWWCDVCKDKEGVFYILRCFNDDEEFIKVGITCTSIKNRYRKKILMPYNYEILYELKSFNLKSLYKI